MIEARQKQMQLYWWARQNRFSDHSGCSLTPTTDCTHSIPDSLSSVSPGNNAFARAIAVENILSSCFGYRVLTPSSRSSSDPVVRPTPTARSRRYLSASWVPIEVPGSENLGMSA